MGMEHLHSDHLRVHLALNTVTELTKLREYHLLLLKNYIQVLFYHHPLQGHQK